MTTNLNAPGTTTQTTTPISGPSTVSQNIQCPTGYMPSFTQGSSNSTWTCVTSNGNSAAATITTTTTPASGSSAVVNQANPSQTTQTVQNGVAGSIPVALASTAPAAPTSTSVSASDMLAEQVQLSSQLSMLQLLLQGADSDKLLVSNGRAVGIRKQTTLSFPITLRPPRPFKHAVAEVRVLVIPRKVADLPNSRIDLVNLLPSEKTYNVAKITSKQKSFGAGVVVEAVNLGVNGGKSRDRLYIAKDTDTVALQYPPNKLEGILAPWPSRIAPAIHNLVMGKSGGLDTDDTCTALPPPQVFLGGDISSGHLNTALYDFQDAVMFGWQFRPVLGASYVASNVRNVFAQIALPADQASESPLELDVFVQTRWRQYSTSAQVTGPSYVTSCQWTVLENSITIDNPIKVKNVEVTDTGGGILRFRAEGDFLSSSFNIRYGPASVPPQFFDGKHIEFFANALDILRGGDIQLVGDDGSETPLRIVTRPSEHCGIDSAAIEAIPRPDGSALVVANVSRGSGFQNGGGRGEDGLPEYKVLVGSDVYGLAETPFLDTDAGSCTAHSCSYRFESQVASLRAARNYLIRDLAWDPQGRRGTIQFAPAFNSIAALAPPQPPPAGVATTWYEVKGTDFTQLSSLCQFEGPACAYPGNDCGCSRLYAYQDNDPPQPVISDPWPAQALPAADGQPHLRVIDGNTLRLRLPGTFPPASGAAQSPSKTVHLVWQQSEETDPVDWALKVSKTADSSSSDATAKISTDPAILYVSDSRAVKFTSSSTLGCFVSAQFEGGIAIAQAPQSSPAPGSAPNTTSVTLQIPSALTATPGYKEIIAMVRAPNTAGGRVTCPAVGPTKQVPLGFLVVGRAENR